MTDAAFLLSTPSEAINQAGAFFLREIPGWREDLVAVRSGPSATIHVPNATLFLLTKLERLSASDRVDCVAILRRAHRLGEPIDAARLTAAIDVALARGASPARGVRLRALRDELDRC